MADVNQEIINAIILRLKNITVANGYAFNVGTVEKPNRDSDHWMPGQNDIYVEIESEEENEDWFCPGNPPRIAFDMTVLINGYGSRIDRDASEVGITDRSVTENVMASAIQKAIANNDAGSWHTFGGYAKTARFAGKQQFDEPGWDGSTMRLVVTYRTSELDASTVG